MSRDIIPESACNKEKYVCLTLVSEVAGRTCSISSEIVSNVFDVDHITYKTSSVSAWLTVYLSKLYNDKIC